MKRNRIFLSLGMVLLISVFILFTNIGKNRAFSYTEETLGFLKEKCRGFDALMGSIEEEETKAAVRGYVEELLTGSQLEMNGVILICNKEQVLCSNYDDYRGRELDKAPFISEIEEGAQPGKLLSLHYYGCTYYGSLDHEGDYDLYVFYPSDEVFHLRNIALFYGISLYAVFSILFFWIHKKEEKEKLIREMACQDKMLTSDKVDMDCLPSGTVTLEQKVFDLEKLLDEVKQWAIPLAAERDVLFSSETIKAEHVKLYGSPVHLKKILTKIVGNAIKDSLSGEQVTFFCRETGASGRKARFEFVCTDTGSSCRENEQGLAVAMELTKLMNGEFHFSHDKGDKAFCRVRFTFIINEENREEERPLVSVIGRKILLVEDNELNMEIAEFILRKEGMDVIRAWNGKEALERFEASAQGEISVILMDLVMPVMDGFEASRSIRALEREDAKNVVIVALTASDYEEDAKKCRLAGMNEHLSKPLDTGNLMRVIHKYIKF